MVLGSRGLRYRVFGTQGLGFPLKGSMRVPLKGTLGSGFRGLGFLEF